MTTTLAQKASDAERAVAKQAVAAVKTIAKRLAPAHHEKPAARGLLVNYRRGRHTQRTNQFLLEVPGIDSRDKATQLAGRRVIWTTPGGKQLPGKILGAHGNKGVVRARFSKGLPPQAIGAKADVY